VAAGFRYSVTTGAEWQGAIMPIGAKMYQQAAEDNKADESTGDKKSDKDEPVEGEVVDEK